MAFKIIHTADWHLGQSFWIRPPTGTHGLKWLAETAADRQIDVLLIAGDVFDVANPSASAQRQFYHFLKEINLANPGLQVVVVARKTMIRLLVWKRLIRYSRSWESLL